MVAFVLSPVDGGADAPVPFSVDGGGKSDSAVKNRRGLVIVPSGELVCCGGSCQKTECERLHLFKFII